MHQGLRGLRRRKWFFAGWNRLGSLLAGLLIMDVVLLVLVARLAMADRPRLLAAFTLLLAALTFVLLIPASLIVIQEEFSLADLLGKLGRSRGWRVAVAAITAALVVSWGALAATGPSSLAQPGGPSPAPVSSAVAQRQTPTSPAVPTAASPTLPVSTQAAPPPTRPVPATATSAPATATAIPATATVALPTATAVPPTATRLPPTATNVPPTATSVPPTATLVLPTPTSAPPTATPAPTSAPPTATSIPPTATRTPPPAPTTVTQGRMVNALVEANDLLVEALARADEPPAELLAYYCGEEAWKKASSFLIQMAQRYGGEIIASYTVQDIQPAQPAEDGRWQLEQSEAWTYRGEGGKDRGGTLALYLLPARPAGQVARFLRGRLRGPSVAVMGRVIRRLAHAIPPSPWIAPSTRMTRLPATASAPTATTTAHELFGFEPT